MRNKFTIASINIIVMGWIQSQAFGAPSLEDGKQVYCYDFAPGGYDIVDFERNLYCTSGGTASLHNCADISSSSGSEISILNRRTGLMRFENKYVQFLEIQLSDRTFIKIYEPTVKSQSGLGDYHRAEIRGAKLVTNPFDLIPEDGSNAG